MKQQLKYDPEDIESLMLAKSFEELLPEERAFVLRHIDSEREYESMRYLLLQSISALQTDPPEPPTVLKENVMDQYRSHFREKPQHGFWLNAVSTFWTPIRQRPYFALAAASVLVFFGIFLWIDPLQESQLAIDQPVQRPGKIEQQSDAPMPEAATEISSTDEEISESEPETVEKPDQPIANTTTDVNESLNQVKDEVEQSFELAEEVEISSEPQEERIASGIAASDNAPTLMADSELSEDTDESAEGTPEGSKNLVNDALFAVMYTAR